MSLLRNLRICVICLGSIPVESKRYKYCSQTCYLKVNYISGVPRKPRPPVIKNSLCVMCNFPILSKFRYKYCSEKCHNKSNMVTFRRKKALYKEIDHA